MVDRVLELLNEVSRKLEQNTTRKQKSEIELYWAACRELQGTYISPGATPPDEVQNGPQYFGEPQPSDEQNIYGGSYIIGSLPFDIASTVNARASPPIPTSEVSSKKRDYSQVDEVEAGEMDDAELEHQLKRARYFSTIEDLVVPQAKTRLFQIKKSQRKNNTQQQSYKLRQNSSTLLSLTQSHSKPHSYSQRHIQHDSFDSSFSSMFSYKTQPTQLIRSRSHSYLQHSQHHQQQQDFSTRYSLRRRHSISSDEDTDLRSKYDLFRKANSKKSEQRKQSQKSQSQGNRLGGMGAVVTRKKKQSQNEKYAIAGPRGGGVEKKQQGRYNLRATRARVNASVVGW